MNRQLLTMVAILATMVAAAQQPFDIDPNFHTSITQISANDVLTLPNGDIMVSGWLRFQGENFDRGYARLSPNGQKISPWPSFNPGGNDMTPYGIDRFYVQNEGAIRRIYFDGSIDTTFNNLTPPYCDVAQGGMYKVLQDSSILFSGLMLLSDTIRGFVGAYGLVWYTNEGYLDTTKVHRRANSPMYFFAQLPTGKFICSGLMSTYEGQSVSRIIRIFPDGALDTSFTPPPFHNFGIARTYAPLNDGRVVIGGYFQFDGEQDTLNLIRLLPNGGLDPTFHLLHFQKYPGTSGSIPYLINIYPLDAGRFIISGDFDLIDGQSRSGIALVDTAGNLLDDYFSSGGCGGFVESGFYRRGLSGIKPTGDGSFYIFGAYRGYDDGTTNDTQQGFVTRLYGLNVGISEQDQFKPKPLTIAPNPTAGSALLSVDEPLQNAQLTLHDASGRVALDVAWLTGSAQYRLPARALAPGAYVANVRTGANTRYSGRLVVLP